MPGIPRPYDSNRNQAKQRLNRFGRPLGIVVQTQPPRQQQQGIPPQCLVSINRLRRLPGLAIGTPPRREAIVYPDRIPPYSTIAVFRVPPPGRVRIAWFFTKPGREGQGIPVQGKRLYYWLAYITALGLRASHNNRIGLDMRSSSRIELAMKSEPTLRLAMSYQTRIDLFMLDP